jgi:pimeloyl-ACP methyl ester carboxylesterase
VTLAGGALDGLELHYATAGRGPATLLIHGLGGFAESWRHTIDALAPHGRVIAPDLPGFGQSAKPRGAYDLAFFAGAVDGLLRALGVERARLVGHSLGGGIAIAYALAHPSRVERLALLSPTVPGFPLRLSLVYRALALPGLGELLSCLVTPRICAVALERCLATPLPDEVAFLVQHQYAARTTAAGRAAYLATLRGVREDFTSRAAAYRAALTDLDRPVLVIHGRQDPVVAPSHVEAALGGVRRAETRWLDRCGHFPQLEHPSTVNGWLGGFLFATTSR